MKPRIPSEIAEPNIKDVAKIAGCSPASVTRALSGYPHMRESLREKIIAVANEIGYRPDLLASSLRKGSSKTIGILVSDILNPSITRIFDIIETDLRDAGYGVIFTNSNGNSEYDLENLLILKQRRVDALIASFSDDSGKELLQQLKILKIPVVLLDRSIDLPNLSEVLTDHKAGAIKLTNHLFEWFSQPRKTYRL
jgi:LacI family transcriptional regulator